MSITLATAWHPRGELIRFLKYLPQLQTAYTRIVITIPPDTEVDIEKRVCEVPGIEVVRTEDWSWGRWCAIQGALSAGDMYIHYIDFDRLLRWIELNPAEWLNALNRIPGEDYMVMGRSPFAYATHPQAIIRTEEISNRIVSFLVGKEIDVSGGSKGFSSKAANYILQNCKPGHALGTDGEWTVALHNAGFEIGYLEVDGLDWESADRYLADAANVQLQKNLAMEYDLDPKNWQHRVAVALEVTEWALRSVKVEHE